MNALILVASAGDGTISTLRQSGQSLETVATSPVGPDCSAFAVDRKRDLVYAATEGAVVTLRLDRESGALTEVSRRDVEGALVHLALAHDGSVLTGASYHDGYATAWPVSDGVLGEAPDRYEFANAHCMEVREDKAYVASLGEDVIAQFTLTTDARLVPLDPPRVPAPEGSGPRHLAIEGANAYLLTEFSAEAIRYAIGADGALTAAESVRFEDPDAGLSHSRYGADPRAEHLIWGADVHVAGRWLLCSERTASTITTISLTEDGHLERVAAITSVPKQPRGFGVSPDGELVIAVGELSPEAVLYRISDDGALAELARATVGAKARWARFV